MEGIYNSVSFRQLSRFSVVSCNYAYYSGRLISDIPYGGLKSILFHKYYIYIKFFINLHLTSEEIT